MAEQQFYTLITNVGQAKLANATALGTKVNFAKLQVGDGKDYNPSEAQENLKHKVWEGNINSITTDSKNKNWIVIQTIIPASVGGFNINEVGIFDNEGNMLIVSKYPSTYKPKLENGSGKDLTIKLVIQVSNTESVTLKIDPSITIATKEDILKIDKTIKENEKNTDEKVKQINTQYEEITQDMTDLKTHVDDGKNNLYSAIVGKKVTPRGKDFKYLTEAIDNIKLGQGTATENDVLEGNTFSSDKGVGLKGNIKRRGNLTINTSVNDKDFGKGHFDNVKMKGLSSESDDTIQNIISSVIQNNGNTRKTLAEKITTEMYKYDINKYQIWKWTGDSFNGAQESEHKALPNSFMVIPFDFKVLIIKHDGYVGRNDVEITQLYFSDDLIKGYNADKYLYRFSDKSGYIYDDFLPYKHTDSGCSAFRITTSNKIEFPNASVSNVVIYAIG